MTNFAKARYPGQDRRITNISSGVYNCCMGVGQIVALLAGPPLAEVIGFRWSCDLIAGTTLLFGLAYLCVGGGAMAFKNTCCTKNSSDFGKAI